MTEHSPLVSVILPVYNGRGVIRRAIQSVFDQDYENYEIIVINDGSTDSTSSILKKYDEEIVLRTQTNLGTMAARNSGVAEAKGRYIAFLDQDDYWAPNKLGVQVEILEKCSQFGLTFSNLEAIDERGVGLGFDVIPRRFRHSPSWMDLLLLYPLYPSSSLVRKDLFENLGGFDTRFSGNGAYGDQDFHIRLREVTEFHYFDACLGSYCWKVNRPERVNNFLENLRVFVKKYWNHKSLVNPGDHGRFARKCADQMRSLAMALLHSNREIASANMLCWMSNFNQEFKDVFGKPYSSLAGLDSIDVSKYQLADETSTLLFLYIFRPDLQRKFPEVHAGNLDRLVKWGLKTSMRMTLDEDCQTLLPLRESLVKVQKHRPSRVSESWANVFDRVFPFGAKRTEPLEVLTRVLSTIRNSV